MQRLHSPHGIRGFHFATYRRDIPRPARRLHRQPYISISPFRNSTVRMCSTSPHEYLTTGFHFPTTSSVPASFPHRLDSPLGVRFCSTKPCSPYDTYLFLVDELLHLLACGSRQCYLRSYQCMYPRRGVEIADGHLDGGDGHILRIQSIPKKSAGMQEKQRSENKVSLHCDPHARARVSAWQSRPSSHFARPFLPPCLSLALLSSRSRVPITAPWPSPPDPLPPLAYTDAGRTTAGRCTLRFVWFLSPPSFHRDLESFGFSSVGPLSPQCVAAG